MAVKKKKILAATDSTENTGCVTDNRRRIDFVQSRDGINLQMTDAVKAEGRVDTIVREESGCLIWLTMTPKAAGGSWPKRLGCKPNREK